MYKATLGISAFLVLALMNCASVAAECPDPEDYCPPPDVDFIFQIVDVTGTEKNIFAEDETPYIYYWPDVELIGGPTWYFIKDPSDNNEFLGDENSISFLGAGNTLPKLPLRMLDDYDWNWFLHEDGTQHAVWEVQATFRTDNYGEEYVFDVNAGFSVQRGYFLNPEPITVTPEPVSMMLFTLGSSVMSLVKFRARRR